MLVIRSAEDNRIVREWRLKLSHADAGTLHWAPDDRSLTVDGGVDGRLGVFRIDAQTGQVTPMVLQPPDSGAPRHQWSADGKTVYFQRKGRRGDSATDVTLIAFDVASNTETEIMRAPAERMARYGTNYAVSPDGRTVYFTRLVTPRDLREGGSGPNEIVARDIATGVERTLWDGAYRDGDLLLSPDGRHIVRNGAANTWMLVPTNGGEPRLLMTFPGIPRCWSADGRALVVTESAPSTAVWFVPVDGREPKKLNMELEQVAYELKLHPDGQRLVFFQAISTGTQNRSPGEVWVDRKPPASGQHPRRSETLCIRRRRSPFLWDWTCTCQSQRTTP